VSAFQTFSRMYSNSGTKTLKVQSCVRTSKVSCAL